MATLSKIGFYLFSGALGAVGVAAGSGALDTPPWGIKSPMEKVGKATPGMDAKKKIVEEAKKVAALEVPEKKQEQEKQATPPKEIFPTFDVLRLEKDGSTLIAGNAAPGSTIEIVIGGKVVATTTAGSNGDFVAILEKPLGPGDHEIAIRSTTKDNRIVTSLETGLVSVPKDKDGELLAMVTKPGEASRILQKAGADTAKTEEEKPAAKEEDVKVAAVENDAKDASKPEAKKPQGETDAENNTGTEKTDKVVGSEDAGNEGKPDEASKQEQAASNNAATSNAAAKTEEKPVDAASAAEPKADTKVAEISKPAAGEKVPTIVVEAVEVEGARIFVAGAAEPGRRIAIYIDNKLLGYAKGTRSGRFLLETDSTLARGFHSVRADVYSADNEKVAARAEVPLVHEPRPDDNVAVAANNQPTKDASDSQPAGMKSEAKSEQKVTEPVAAKMDETKKEQEASTPAASTPASEEKPEKPADVASKTDEEPKIALAADTAAKKIEPEIKVEAKQLEQVKKTEDNNTASKDKPVEVTRVSAVEKKVEAAKAPVVEKKDEAAAAPAVEKKVETAKVTIAENKPEVAKAPKVEKAPDTAKPAKKEKKADQPAMAKDDKPLTAPAMKKDEPVEKKKVEVASLDDKDAIGTRPIHTGSAVIIRRGDSLWRISYRTYGRGIRYSTIYEANLKQLKNPHKIYPGQILRVPKMKFDKDG